MRKPIKNWAIITRNMRQKELSELDVEVSEEDIPANPGPAVTGRTPVLGTVRRKNGIPVVRDELAAKMGEM